MPSEVRPGPSEWTLAPLETVSAFATPKSVTTATPWESSTLSGLMSRWTTPRVWAYARAEATSRSTRTAWGTGSSRSRISRARSDSPSTYGIVK
jgi:hypothetical protein